MTKRLIISLLLFIGCVTASWAQIPYYGATVGENHLYAYHSLKFRPGLNQQTTYTTLQYGLTPWLALGTDLTTASGARNIGYSCRVGRRFNPWFSAGLQVTPSFDLNDSHAFAYNTTGLFMNGNITRDGKLYWVSNTWHTASRDDDNSCVQWWYLGSYFQFRNGSNLWPYLGMIHSWEFNEDVDLAAGLYYSYKRYGFYLWGNDFLKEHPRVVIAVEFTL